MVCTRKPQTDLVYICDWLPPDFGAVGQYSLGFARELAAQGRDVVLIGLSSQKAALQDEAIGEGHLKKICLRAKPYDKGKTFQRVSWTFATNSRLLVKAWPYLRQANEIIFTGSPPLFLHWIASANLILRKSLTYRITDFHPECLMAEMEKSTRWLNILYEVTLFWRRRVTRFEALGHDQIERLSEIGIPKKRIVLKPDPSPVSISHDTWPLKRPEEGANRYLLLYSGNWGVAHDYETFIEGYTRHHREYTGQILLWLNAVGIGAARVAQELEKRKLPFVRGEPVPLERLASLLVTPDAHLITLKDPFVGFVLPSKVHGCIESAKPILFIGSEKSDVHRLCQESANVHYQRVDVGDYQSVAEALNQLAAELDNASQKSVARIVR